MGAAIPTWGVNGISDANRDLFTISGNITLICIELGLTSSGAKKTDGQPIQWPYRLFQMRTDTLQFILLIGRAFSLMF
jgi:hypothetical protein